MKKLMTIALTTVFVTGSFGALHAGSCGSSKSSASAAGHHEAAKNIIETAVSAGNFGTLAAALEAADLVDALQGDGPFTVFAPTDAAFARLPEGTVEQLLRPENRGKLVKILTYHVVSGEYTARDVTRIDAAETLSGGEVAFRTAGGNVLVEDAFVSQADIECSNGVIHVIDTVLIPN